MSVLAYIPARGGSKRVPRKNVKLLAGKPVLGRVIESIRASGLAKAVVVSTDDDAIKAVAVSAGAVVLDLREARLSADDTTLMSLLKEDVPRHLTALDFDPAKTTVLFALATAALVDAAVYRDAHATFIARNASVLAATTGFSHSPYRALAETPAGDWKPLFPEKLLTFSQGLPKTQVDAGLFYFLDFAAMSREPGHWFNVQKGLACHPVPPSMAVDVDTPEDWAELEHKYRALHETADRRP
jgi:N-acylneuraminate cytidylyltransferase